MSQFIICRVADQYFTVSILSTNRIVPLENVTHVPDTMDYIMGIMESEEEVLPIVDLSKRFFDKSLADEKSAQVLITYWKEREIGLAVDEVLTIKEYDESQIDYQLEKITTLNKENQATPIKSFIRTDEGLILELDIEHLFEETGTIEINQLFDIQQEVSEEEE